MAGTSTSKVEDGSKRAGVLRRTALQTTADRGTRRNLGATAAGCSTRPDNAWGPRTGGWVPGARGPAWWPGRADGLARNVLTIGGSAGAFPRAPQDATQTAAASSCGRRRRARPQPDQRDVALPVCEATTGDTFEQGRMYVALPDVHMRLTAGRIELDRGPTVHYTRSAVDALFVSAGAAYGAAW